MSPTESVLIPLGIAIVASFALGGVLVLGVMGVISFIRAWGRGEPEFSSSMPPQVFERSPLHSLEARFAEGELGEEETRQRMREQVDAMQQRRDADRQAIEERSTPESSP
jgi:hypothetical protein